MTEKPGFYVDILNKDLSVNVSKLLKELEEVYELLKFEELEEII